MCAKGTGSASSLQCHVGRNAEKNEVGRGGRRGKELGPVAETPGCPFPGWQGPFNSWYSYSRASTLGAGRVLICCLFHWNL